MDDRELLAFGLLNVLGYLFSCLHQSFSINPDRALRPDIVSSLLYALMRVGISHQSVIAIARRLQYSSLSLALLLQLESVVVVLKLGTLAAGVQP